MGSSKVWRKGRWFWYCINHNGATNWKDSHSCVAVSRLTYSTEAEAIIASRGHKHPFDVNVTQVKAVRKRATRRYR